MQYLKWKFSFTKKVKTRQAKANNWFWGKGRREGKSGEEGKIKKLPQTDCRSLHSSRGKAKQLREQHTLVWKHRPDLEQIGGRNHKTEILYDFCQIILTLTPSNGQQSQGKFNQRCSDTKRNNWNETSEESWSTNNSWDTCKPPNPVTLVPRQADGRLIKCWKDHNVQTAKPDTFLNFHLTGRLKQVS